MIKLLPVGADPAGDPSQNGAGQVRNTNPGIDQIAAVIGNEMKVVGIGDSGSSHELIAQLELQGSAVPGHAGDGPFPGKNQILEVFAHRAAEPKVVVLLDKVIKQILPFGPAHLPDLQLAQSQAREPSREVVSQNSTGATRR